MGLLHGPAVISQSLSVDAAVCRINRSADLHGYALINKSVENSIADGNVSVGVGVSVDEYFEDSPGFPASGNDYLKLAVTVSGNLSTGFVHSVFVRFLLADSDTGVIFEETPSSIQLTDLELKGIHSYGTSLRGAFLETAAVNQSRSVFLSMTIFWIFFDKNSMTHSAMSKMELVYFDGETYRMVSAPIQLEAILP